MTYDINQAKSGRLSRTITIHKAIDKAKQARTKIWLPSG